jgi:hypothetical protein
MSNQATAKVTAQLWCTRVHSLHLEQEQEPDSGFAIHTCTRLLFESTPCLPAGLPPLTLTHSLTHSSHTHQVQGHSS